MLPLRKPSASPTAIGSTASPSTKREFYSVDGVLTHRRPRHIDETVDLHGLFVVPPYGDAHEHNFDSVPRTPAVSQQYLKDGIFYAQGMTESIPGSQAVVKAGLVNTPATVDVTYAHAGLTGVNGHPKDTYEGILFGIYNPRTQAEREKIIASHARAGETYWEIDKPADLDAKWPSILATRPDLIKIFLHESEHFTPEMHINPPLGGGLDPALVPLIVQRAHAAHLKVAAHVDTAIDYHNAIVSHVDELAHVPGYCLGPHESAGPYRLTDADIALTATRRITVIPTASFCDNDYSTPDARAATRSVLLDNLARLKAAGVNIIIGSDNYGRDSLHEARYLHSLGLWSNLELLRMWCEATPHDIFPKRRIGKLQPDYEATFLVLARNPLDDWSATEEISERWKQGRRIVLFDNPKLSP